MISSKFKYLRLAMPVPLRKFFDYLPPPEVAWEHLQPGVRVRVPFQKRELIGIFTEFCENSTVPLDKLKSSLAILDDSTLIPDDIFELCLWASDYYHHPVGEVFAAALPLLLRQGKPPIIKKALKEKSYDLKNSDFSLMEGQEKAINQVLNVRDSFQVFFIRRCDR